MSSATPYNPSGVRKMIAGIANRLMTGKKQENAQQINDRIKRLGLSPRQQRLNHAWSWYRCDHYSGRKVDWNGGSAVDPIEHEAIATAGFIPPGFYDAGSTMPIRFRKPSAPYALNKVIVDRFTSLLFSEQKHPHIKIIGDADSEDFITVLIEQARLWAVMIQARQYGGAMGTTCLGFQFVDGNLVIEVHDPRWVEPTFIDRVMMSVKQIEKKYMYPVDEKDPVTGKYETVWYWYRRIIDENSDTLFKPAPVADGDEPEWQEESKVEHGLGFCPIVWVQNLPVQDDVDGDPDCIGAFEMFESIDSLVAQANKGILGNCDPSVVITSDAEMSEVRKGSDNALKLPPGSTAGYMEITGSGPKAALDFAELLRKFALEVTQCVLDHPEMKQRTATEIERTYSSMLAKADILREQYGQKCIVPLVEMILKAIQKLDKGKYNEESGMLERQKIFLPRHQVFNADTGTTEDKEYTLGNGGVVTLQWPHYFEALLSDIELATRSAIAAKAGGLIDAEHASKFVAEYFKVEDVHSMLEKVHEEQVHMQEDIANNALSMLGSKGVDSQSGIGGMEM